MSLKLPCPKCKDYNAGRGTKQCLECKDIQTTLETNEPELFEKAANDTVFPDGRIVPPKSDLERNYARVSLFTKTNKEEMPLPSNIDGHYMRMENETVNYDYRNSLTPSEYTVVEERFKGSGWGTIAKDLGKDKSTVCTLYRRAVDKLKANPPKEVNRDDDHSVEKVLIEEIFGQIQPHSTPLSFNGYYDKREEKAVSETGAFFSALLQQNILDVVARFTRN